MSTLTSTVVGKSRHLGSDSAVDTLTLRPIRNVRDRVTRGGGIHRLSTVQCAADLLLGLWLDIVGYGERTFSYMEVS